MPKTPSSVFACGLVAATVLAGCAEGSPERERVLLVTTTSVEGSGLLDEVLEAYHAAQNRYRLAPTAVGSGAALQMGRRGDADILITHDPAGERAFAEAGFAVDQGPVMMNHFLIAGPPGDAARVVGAAGLEAALRGIADAGARFVSRGDDSGTHARERELWRGAGLAPWQDRPDWYVEAGTGMAETLQMASQLGAYTLTDRGTFLHLRGSLDLRPLVERGAKLENHYTYTLPRDAANVEGARDFLAWLTGPGQALIRSYGTDRFGEPLFVPTAAPDSVG
jgi:tungstate transport system substrate-binding protein